MDIDSTTLSRIFRPQPEALGVISASTPVISFGNPLFATSATLGINPSSAEFLDTKQRILSPNAKRLADMETLGKEPASKLTESDALKIVNACNDYFQIGGNYLSRWFDPLNDLLLKPLGFDYMNGSACHLDLVQWATYPVWGRLSQQQRNQLLADDVSFLKFQMRQRNYDVVLLNGRTTINQVTDIGLFGLKPFKKLRYSVSGTERSVDTFTGKTPEGGLVFAWSANIQSMRATSVAKTQLTHSLVELIQDQME